MNLKQQIRRLLALELLGNFRVAGGVWVLLLVGRGFSLVQVGLAEAFFHAVSLCGEIPSGMAADVLGRKKAMMASQAMFILSSLAMLLSRTMAGVCAAMALSALAYNLASGTREALTYDSLVQGGAESAYLRVSSLQNSLWRLASGLSTLCAGLAVAIGYQAGYAADALLALAGLLLACPGWWRAARGRPQASCTLTPGCRSGCSTTPLWAHWPRFCASFSRMG